MSTIPTKRPTMRRWGNPEGVWFVHDDDPWNEQWATNRNPFPFAENWSAFLFPRIDRFISWRADFADRLHKAWGVLRGELECPW